MPAELGRLWQPIELSVAPSSSIRRTSSGRKSSSAPSSVDLPAPRPSAATTTGTRPSISSHSVAASSASSVPAWNQLHDGTCDRRDVADGPPAPRGRGVGQGGLRICAAVPAPEASVGPLSGSVKRVFHALDIPGRFECSWKPATGCPDGSTSIVRCRLDILPLTPDRLSDLATLFEQGGDPKWCWCAYFRVRSIDFSNVSKTRHRSILATAIEDNATEGRAPGLVAYDDGVAVGWISIGPRDDYERLVHSSSWRRWMTNRSGRSSVSLWAGSRAARVSHASSSTLGSPMRGIMARRCSRRIRRTSLRASASRRRTCIGHVGDVRAGGVRAGRSAPGPWWRQGPPDRPTAAPTQPQADARQADGMTGRARSTVMAVAWLAVCSAARDNGAARGADHPVSDGGPGTIGSTSSVASPTRRPSRLTRARRGA